VDLYPQRPANRGNTHPRVERTPGAALRAWSGQAAAVKI